MTHRWGSISAPVLGSRYHGKGEITPAPAQSTVPCRAHTREEREEVRQSFLNHNRPDETVSECDSIAFDLAPGSNVTTREVDDAAALSAMTRVIENEGFTRTAGGDYLLQTRQKRDRKPDRREDPASSSRSGNPKHSSPSGSNRYRRSSDTPSPCSQGSAQTSGSMSDDAPSNVPSYLATPTFSQHGLEHLWSSCLVQLAKR